MLLGKDSRRKWGKWDFALARAYQRYLAELCQSCGLPKYVCHSEDNRLQFRLHEDKCEATAAADRERERRQKAQSKRGGRSDHGVTLLPEPYFIEGSEVQDFSELRRPYYEDLARKRGLIPG